MTDTTNHDMTHQMLLPNERARGAIAAGFGVIAVFFFGMGGWAAYAPLNGAVVAPAVVKVEGNRETIQHLDGGIVKKLLVKEGDRVAIGQSLIILDDARDKVMDIVPSQNGLVTEANINVDDIHDIHPGMRAELHFTAYKQRVIPVIHGDVVEVSADRQAHGHALLHRARQGRRSGAGGEQRCPALPPHGRNGDASDQRAHRTRLPDRADCRVV